MFYESGFIPTILMLVYILVPVIIAVLIGIYVYRDAKSRNMGPVGWTLVAVLVPGLIGLIIYLIVRGGHKNYRCPQCGGPVEITFISCPACGCRMKDTCPSCGRAIEADWKFCPDCATELPEQRTATPPTQKKEKGFWPLIIIIIAAVVLFTAAVTVLFDKMIPTDNVACYSSEALELSDLAPEFQTWAKKCDEQGPGYYVLAFNGGDDKLMDPLRNADEALDDTWSGGHLWAYSHNYAFLIYHVGGKTYFAESLVDQSDGLFPRNYVNAHFNEDEVSPTGNPIFISYSSNDKSNPEDIIKIIDKGEKIDYSYARLKDGKVE